MHLLIRDQTGMADSEKILLPLWVDSVNSRFRLGVIAPTLTESSGARRFMGSGKISAEAIDRLIQSAKIKAGFCSSLNWHYFYDRQN